MAKFFSLSIHLDDDLEEAQQVIIFRKVTMENVPNLLKSLLVEGHDVLVEATDDE